MGFTSPEQYDALSDEEEFEARRRKVDYEASIYAIDGPAHDDLYLAGLNATLIHFDGTEYHRIETGQESSFTDVILHEGEVYIIGAHRGSVILKGTAKEGFAPIAEVDEDRLWFGSMCFWQGALYVGDALKARGGVYRLEGDQLRKLPGLEGPIIRLEAAGGVLWALQEKALHRFDGESWQHFESPFG